MNGKILSRAFQRVFVFGFFGVLVDLLRFFEVLWKMVFFEFSGNWLTMNGGGRRLVADDGDWQRLPHGVHLEPLDDVVFDY